MTEFCLCDDNEEITDYISSFIRKNFGDEASVSKVHTCKEVYGKIMINRDVPDVLFMDVNLGDGNGIETVKEIQKEYPMLKVIYLTGYIGYATNIFETNPSYFLTKPIEDEKLMAALRKVIGRVDADKKDSVILKSNGTETAVPKKDIIYIESGGRKLTIHAEGGRDFVIYEKMDDMQNSLDSRFLRCHKSFLVNMKYIAERTNKTINLVTGEALPISKANLKDVKMKFISYLGDSQWD